MASYRDGIISALLVGVVFLALSLAWVRPVLAYDPLVEELKTIVEGDARLQGDLKRSLDERPNGNYWNGKRPADIYDLFDRWLTHLPTPSATETIYTDILRQLYSQTPGDSSRELPLSIVRNPPISTWLTKFVRGRATFLDSVASKSVVPMWLSDPRIKPNDFLIPTEGYASFNDFFTRMLAPGARSIDAPENRSVLTSPADCSVSKLNAELKPATRIAVKGEVLNLAELLRGSSVADKFDGGGAILCALDIFDYHHFHSPLDGEVLEVALVDGLYFGTTRSDFLIGHHRGYYVLRSEEFGLVAVVPVGIANISSVNLAKSKGDIVAKGSRIGHFAMGGSLIVLLFQKDQVVLEASNGTKLLMGQRFGKLVK